MDETYLGDQVYISDWILVTIASHFEVEPGVVIFTPLGPSQVAHGMLYIGNICNPRAQNVTGCI